MTTKKSTCLAFLLVLLIAGCKKDDDAIEIEPYVFSLGVHNCDTDSIYASCTEDEYCDIFVIVENPPRFYNVTCESFDRTADKVECARDSLHAYLKQHVVYPQEAINNGIEGDVVVSFVVHDVSGCLTKMKVVRDIGYGCGQAVLDVFMDMPPFTIGTQRQRNVPTRLNILHEFRL